MADDFAVRPAPQIRIHAFKMLEQLCGADGALASGLLSGAAHAVSPDVTKPANGIGLCW